MSATGALADLREQNGTGWWKPIIGDINADMAATMGNRQGSFNWRTGLAFLLAPSFGVLTATIIRCVMLGDFSQYSVYTLLIVFAVFGYPLAIIAGVPAYFWFRRQSNLTPISCTVLGGIIAVLPVIGANDDGMKLAIGVGGAITGVVFFIIALSGIPKASVASECLMD